MISPPPRPRARDSRTPPPVSPPVSSSSSSSSSRPWSRPWSRQNRESLPIAHLRSRARTTRRISSERTHRATHSNVLHPTRPHPRRRAATRDDAAMRSVDGVEKMNRRAHTTVAHLSTSASASRTRAWRHTRTRARARTHARKTTKKTTQRKSTRRIRTRRVMSRDVARNAADRSDRIDRIGSDRIAPRAWTLERLVV